LGDRGNIAYILEGQGIVAGARGEAGRAARLLGASEALISAIGLHGHTYYRPDRALYGRIEARARATLDRAAVEAAMEEGRAMSPERAIEYALKEPSMPEGGGPNHEEAMRIPLLTASGSFGVSRASAIMPREGAARKRRSEMIRALLIVVVIVTGLMLLLLIPFLDLP
jgi:hypothetical protein